jgi:3-methyladenine DNA glycosylase/8-oxoguanine DNA glycosylase
MAVVPEAPVVAQTFAVPAAYDFDGTLRFTRFGPGDPTARRGPAWFVKAWRSPAGPVTLRLEQGSPGAVTAAAWGAGAEWVLPRVPPLLGLHDSPPPVTMGPPLRRLARRFAGMRLARVPWPLDKLVGSILQQRVAFDDAVASWRALLRRHGVAAPGPAGVLSLPEPAALLRVPDHDWRAMGVDRSRQGAVREALRYAHRVHETVSMDLAAVRRRLGALRGVGPWTVEMTMGFGYGDPDAVPPGDYHLPDVVSWMLAGEARGDDARMIALLHPYAGQRFRVIRWLYGAGASAPRRGPRAMRMSGRGGVSPLVNSNRYRFDV